MVFSPDGTRQRLMRGGQVVGVETLAVGRLLAVEAGAVQDATPFCRGLASSAETEVVAPRAHPRTTAVMARAVEGLVTRFRGSVDAVHDTRYRYATKALSDYRAQ